jgi:hypothetical protein
MLRYPELSDFRFREERVQSLCLRARFDSGMIKLNFLENSVKNLKKTEGLNLQWMQFPTCRGF